MTPMQQYQQEVKDLSKKILRDNMPEAYKIMVEYVSLVNNPMHMISDRLTMVQQGSDKKYMNERGLVKCKAKDASGLMYVSKWDAERNDWISISHTYVKSSAN